MTVRSRRKSHGRCRFDSPQSFRPLYESPLPLSLFLLFLTDMAFLKSSILFWGLRNNNLLTFFLKENLFAHPLNNCSLSRAFLRFLFTGSYDSFGRVWKVEGLCTHVFEGHRDAITSTALITSSDSNDNCINFATASKDRTLQLWQFNPNEHSTDIIRIKPRKTLRGHTSSVQTVSTSPRGDLVCSGSWDCSIKIWQVPGLSDTENNCSSVKKRKLEGGAGPKEQLESQVDLETLVHARQLNIVVIGQDALKTNDEVASLCTVLVEDYKGHAHDLLQLPYIRKLLLAGILLDTQNLDSTAVFFTARDRAAVDLLLVGVSPYHRYTLFGQLNREHNDSSFEEALQYNYGEHLNTAISQMASASASGVKVKINWTVARWFGFGSRQQSVKT